MFLQRLTLVFLFAAACVLSLRAEAADAIASDDFQTGSYSSWVMTGNGNDSINHYQGNDSLRLDGLRAGMLSVSTAGYDNVSLSMDLAALYLVSGDSCYAEYSIDAGTTWNSLVQVGSAAADGSMQTGSVTSGLDDNADVRVRFRSYTLFGHYCYGDNVSLAGTALPVEPGGGSAAESVFDDDFQDGMYANWSTGGANGHAQINLYNSNYSLRLDGLYQGTASVSTEDYKNVSLSMEMAATALVNGDHCYAEYSVDGGTSWTSVLVLGNGDDDGQMRQASISAGLDDNPDLQLRFRSDTWFQDYCYGDNVTVEGEPMDGGPNDPPGSPDISVPSAVGFGSVPAGDLMGKSVTITNTGDAALIIGQIVSPDAPFSVTSDTCLNASLAPSSSCAVSLEFAPVSQGAFSDSLTIPSNDPQTSTAIVTLTATATSQGSGGNPYDPLNGTGAVSRNALGYSVLAGSGTIGLVDYGNYALPSAAANPSNIFEGRLQLSGQNGGQASDVGGSSPLSAYTRGEQLPDFDFQFVQDGTHIIPVQRGRILTSHPSWNLVLEPGRVWNENGDQGWSRVALPFSLQEGGADCLHNGVMMFLFKDDGSISDVAYQFAGETCEYTQANFWGRLQATYTPAGVTDANTIKVAYEDEVARRMPIKPIADLATDYPSSGVIVANIAKDVTAAHMTVYGVAYNGVNYMGGCATREGTYPYCQVIDLPSYSTAKSAVGAYGLMRLEKLYPGARNETIASHVPECAGSQWTAPTLQNTLDMATGNYDSSGFEVDEGSTGMVNNFLIPELYSNKVNFACGYTQKTNPGTQWVYHSSDTFLLGVATDDYYKSKNGISADFFDDELVDNIYKPLGLSPTSYKSQRTADTANMPYTAYGMIWVPDNVVKLARFLNNGQGKISGTQVLDSNMVSATLNLGNGGLAAGSSNDRYKNGFWYYNLAANWNHDYGCSGPTWVPYMSGFGGISIVLLPNGMVYYDFSDNNEGGWASAAGELDKVAPMCP